MPVLILTDYLAPIPSGLHLRLDGVTLDAKAFDRLVLLVQANPRIRRLSMRNLGLGPKLAVFVADLLATNCTLTAVDLSGNAIGSHGAKCLATVLLERNATLQELSLARCGLHSDAFLSWIEFFERASPDTTFHTLNVAHNAIGDDGALALAKALEHERQLPLRGWRFDLRRNGITDVGVTALATLLAKTHAVVQLDVANARSFEVREPERVVFLEHRCRRNAAEMHTRVVDAAVRTILASTRRAESMVLENVPVSVAQAVGLAHALKHTLATTNLTLRNNALCLAALQRLAEGLAFNQTLYRLTLRDNGVSGDAFVALLSALARNATPPLRELEISHATQLPMPLWPRRVNGRVYRFFTQTGHQLTHITLDHCGLTDVDVGAIVAGLAWNGALQAANFGRNHITDAGVRIFHLLLHRCANLASLDISGNQCTLDGIVSVVARASDHLRLRSLRVGRFPEFSPTLFTIASHIGRSDSLLRFEIAAANDHSRYASAKAAIQATLNLNRKKNPVPPATAFAAWTRHCRGHYMARDVAHSTASRLVQPHKHIIAMRLLHVEDVNVLICFACCEMASEDIDARLRFEWAGIVSNDIDATLLLERRHMQSEDVDVV
ncbi:hypothetical protein SPRG_22097 [Saprolegnia parasitica CBS 223.65]|uniref:RNI-like protein n=1 Tax=Saprolegnia parasitica (strain CBS 223.65) TaxID=695850 RepID=A0A067D3W9_SAPPC|nr:hypothetical protein SPRG_22097 [Saprolegnia parasitica CBS 223.65]KDO33692.1 hypothetical protein SPRG_22097 [Saprolegnia parasitica CBS 223.65]|eukprot:XP_012195775.1 hypothetical protein SPRG_22097 [Saprolegnia parasitica CBS 223.65]